MNAPNTNSPNTILVVDDDGIVLELLTDVLTMEGHRVITTANGREAATICREQPIHLIILDYMMPGISGEEVVRQVREFEHDVQIIIQTAQDLIPPRTLLRELDIQGYHSKGEKLSRLLLWVDVALKNYDQIRSRRAIENSLLALGLALEARDLETAGHTQRVVTMAARMGQQLDLNSWRLEALRQGAYLHDLGKLCIPDAVLLKPGRLDQHEWEIMKSHAQRGFELASTIPSIRPEALEVIQFHHEHWDGFGYPASLGGANIPLLARIFAICDVYDALISPRVYKAAWSEVDAVGELQQQRNCQFDAEIVDLFVSMWAEAAFDDLRLTTDQATTFQPAPPLMILPSFNPVAMGSPLYAHMLSPYPA
jgi:response regulator RpfG family c-di-GMP phosphodiesterase